MAPNLCVSCKKNVGNDAGNVRFQCPQCSNYEIVRCKRCRTSAAKYTCTNCSFVGPN